MGNARRRAARPAVAADFDWRPWACAAALVLAVLLTFSPAFHADFIRWDDTHYVTKNDLLRSPNGLKEIWTPLGGKLPQYYPLTFTSYWIEYQFWQLGPTGYHVTNVVLHAANSVLVLALLRALGGSLWLAVGAAGVFALHPVQVESVIWVAERKNTLSGFFFLLAFLLYLRHRRSNRWGPYAACLLVFLCALLSKTQTVSLPVIIAATDWLLLRRGPLRRADVTAVVTRVAPMLVLGLISAWMTTAVERQMTSSWVQLPTLLQRAPIAGTALWYYVATFLAPFDIAPIVPKWVVSPTDPKWWVGPLAWAVVIPLSIRWSARVPALVLWGAIEFAVALLPGIGLVPFAYQHYSYVAMRFLYLSCIGGGVVVAVVAERLAGSGHTGRRLAAAAGGLLVLLTYGILSYREAQHWQSNFSFWTYAVERNPDGYPPNMNLGLHYELTKEWSEALRFYRHGHELRPLDTHALTQYLRALGAAQGPQAVIDVADTELQRSKRIAYVYYFQRAVAYEQVGHVDAAIADYNRVVTLADQGSSLQESARRALARLVQRKSP